MDNFKRTISVLGIMLASVCFTGCATSIVALNDDENKVVARYISDKLLQNDINYKKNELVYIEPTEAPETEAPATQVPAQPTAAPPETQSPVTGGQQSEGEELKGETLKGGDGVIKLNEILANDEWSITYSSYDTYKTYPKKSDVYSINASDGNQLLVLFFDIKNLTDEKIKVNLADYNLNYKLYIGENGYNSQIAVLDNGGLMYLRTSISAGKTEKAELVFEVPEGIGLDNLRLDVSK